MRNNITCILLLQLFLICYGCDVEKHSEETIKVEYWIQDFSSKDFPKLLIDTVQDTEVQLMGFLIPTESLRQISELPLDKEMFSYLNYFGFYFTQTKVPFLDTSVVVSRFLLADNKELNGAVDVFYARHFGVVMKKYHGNNYEILDRVIWFQEGKELSNTNINDLIQGIFDDEIINPQNMRY